MINVSVIIVNYNTKELIRACLKSVIQNTLDINYEIIVSDNGSKDGSIDMIKKEFPNVILIENNRNLGFGAANNRAIKIAKGKYIFYLNSDTVLLNNAVKLFYDFWEKNDKGNIGVLGAQLLDKNNYPTLSCAKYPTPNGVLKALLHMYFFPQIKKKKVFSQIEIPKNGMYIKGYISGAVMFLKNDADALFDEQYFMYAEEVDLEYNHFYKKNKDCIIIPDVKIIHFEGGSDKTSNKKAYDFAKKSVIYLWLSNVKYLRKNYSNSVFHIFIIKKILLWIWGKRKYRTQTKEYIAELKKI